MMNKYDLLKKAFLVSLVVGVVLLTPASANATNLIYGLNITMLKNLTISLIDIVVSVLEESPRGMIALFTVGLLGVILIIALITGMGIAMIPIALITAAVGFITDFSIMKVINSMNRR